LARRFVKSAFTDRRNRAHPEAAEGHKKIENCCDGNAPTFAMLRGGESLDAPEKWPSHRNSL
jgi:hypothetical protein